MTNRLSQPLPLWLWPIIGGVSALGFQPNNIWPLSLATFALLLHQLRLASPKRAFWVGWLFGIGHFTVGLRWIAVAFTFQAAMPAWLGYLAVVALSLYLALFPAIATLIARRIGGSKPVALTLALAGSWILTEFLRSQLFTGFAWNPLSVLAVDVGWVTRYIGTYGLSGLLILLAGALAWGMARQWRAAVAIGAVPVLALLWGVYAQSRPGLPPTDQPISIIQPNIGQEEKHDLARAAASFLKLARLTVDSTPDNRDTPPRLVFWPEAATRWALESGYPSLFYTGQPGESAVATRMAFAALLRPGDVLVTGGDRLEFDDRPRLIGARNSVMAISSGAKILGSYDKAHLVPYGEYLPMQKILIPLGLRRLVPGSIDFWPGPGADNIDLGQGFGNVGIQICYEIIFSGEVVNDAERPRFIFNPSNDAWFGIVGPPQHLAQARLRAVEEGLPVIRSTPTGISAIIDARGRMVKSLPLGTAGHIDGTLPAAFDPTPFSRFGNWIPGGLAVLFLLLSLVAKNRYRL